jgi:hypothetical protein
MHLKPNVQTVDGIVAHAIVKEVPLDYVRTHLVGSGMAAADELKHLGAVSQATAQALIDYTAAYDRIVLSGAIAAPRAA